MIRQEYYFDYKSSYSKSSIGCTICEYFITDYNFIVGFTIPAFDFELLLSTSPNWTERNKVKIQMRGKTVNKGLIAYLSYEYTYLSELYVQLQLW